MDNIILNKILKSINNGKKFKNYLGVFTIEEYNALNLKNKKNFSLILFISNISKNLGHFVTIFKSENKIFFCDSYGKNVTFYKKKIKNINFYLNYKLQSNNTTICGGYSIFFVHIISLCKYKMICFKKIFLDFFNFKRRFINDKYIKNYLFLIYPKLNNKYCKYLFCNKNFIINYENCEKVLCQFKKKKH